MDVLGLAPDRPLGAPTLKEFETGVANPLCHAYSRHSANGAGLSVRGIAAYRASGLRLRTRADMNVEQEPYGKRMVDDATAMHAAQAAVSQWRSDIRTWLSDKSATWPLTVTVCMPQTVGETLKSDEWEQGDREWTATPLAEITLEKTADPRFPEGYRISSIAPGRGF